MWWLRVEIYLSHVQRYRFCGQLAVNKLVVTWLLFLKPQSEINGPWSNAKFKPFERTSGINSSFNFETLSVIVSRVKYNHSKAHACYIHQTQHAVFIDILGWEEKGGELTVAQKCHQSWILPRSLWIVEVKILPGATGTLLKAGKTQGIKRLCQRQSPRRSTYSCSRICSRKLWRSN